VRTKIDVKEDLDTDLNCNGVFVPTAWLMM